MKINWAIFLKIGARVFGALITLLTPEIRDIVEKSVKEWEAKAEETLNPWDDMFVATLKGILGID